MHSVTNEQLDWDAEINSDQKNEWKKICKQYNANIHLHGEVPRYVGDYHVSYNILAFTDSSKNLYGVVMYLQSVSTGETYFLMARNKIITKNLKSRSIPILELIAVLFSVQCLQEMYKE